MTDQDFIRMFKRSGTKMLIIGVSIFLFGVFLIWLVASGADSEMEPGSGTAIAMWIFGSIVALLGVLMMALPVVASSRIKNGKHKLINAVLQNDTGYALWIYEHVIRVKSGPASNTNHQVWIMARDKKQYQLGCKKAKVAEVITYLAGKFPDAILGHSPELESQYHQKLRDIEAGKK